MAELHGWQADPFGLHEQRYFSQGQPTKLVRDQGREAYDPPPTETALAVPQSPPVASHPPPATPGSESGASPVVLPGHPPPSAPLLPAPPQSVSVSDPNATAPARSPSMPPPPTSARVQPPAPEYAAQTPTEDARRPQRFVRTSIPKSPPPQPPPRPGWKRGLDGEWHPPEPDEVAPRMNSSVVADVSPGDADGPDAVAGSEAAMYQVSTFDSRARADRFGSAPQQPPPRFPSTPNQNDRPPSRPDAMSRGFEASLTADLSRSSETTWAGPTREAPPPTGNGWWLASDGNWYPPEPRAEAEVNGQSPPEAPPSPGPGWWLASDLNWYPPETAPDGQPLHEAPPSPGPGWWLASDLNWYPLESAPQPTLAGRGEPHPNP